MEGAGGEGKERGKGGRDFTDTGTFLGGGNPVLALKSQMGGNKNGKIAENKN